MIEQTKEGWYVVSGDTHIGLWVRETGTLCHDQFACDYLKPYIKEGMSVLDVGGNIGTMCRFFLNQGAKVIAFEPQIEPYECLKRNCSEAVCHNFGLSDEKKDIWLVLGENKGAAYMAGKSVEGYNMQFATLQVLDDILPDYPIDFIKADLEGGEVKMLKGAKNLLAKYRPTCFIEVNKGALERQGNTKEELFELLKEYGYEWRIAQPDCNVNSLQYDILATPRIDYIHDGNNGQY